MLLNRIASGNHKSRELENGPAKQKQSRGRRQATAFYDPMRVGQSGGQGTRTLNPLRGT